jgi:phosphoribosylamine--glycine ligase
MGAYSPVPQIGEDVVTEAIQTVLLPTVRGMLVEETPFTGILYAGLMKTANGPKVIEFNARFGDPETQVILSRLESDLVQVVLDVLAGQDPMIQWSEKAVVGVVVAAKGYPDSYEKGHPIEGLEEVTGAYVFHAGTALHEGQIVTDGGRVLLVASSGTTIQEAQKEVYSQLQSIRSDQLFYRKDIGYKAIAHASV